MRSMASGIAVLTAIGLALTAIQVEARGKRSKKRRTAPPSASPKAEADGERGQDIEVTTNPGIAGAEVLRLTRGLKLLEMQEHDAARAELERALEEGPYSHEEVVALYRSLGIVRAFADDTEGARWAFGRMLSVNPTLILSYTISPKATFVFERVRNEMKDLKGAQVLIETAPVVPLDRPIPVIISTRSDPFRHIERLELLHRVKGEAEYQRIPLVFPPVGSQVDLEVPAVSASRAKEQRGGKRGTLVELALVGYDANGWEVYRGPPPERPQEVAVGFDAAGPWYTQWWAYGLVASGLTAVATAVVVAALLWPPGNEVDTSYEVTQ